MTSQGQIPSIYKIVLTWIEPILAGGGMVQVLLDPESYVQATDPALTYSPLLTTMFLQIIAGWAIIIFNDIVTLRVFSNDVKVWKCVLGAHLCSDIIYTIAMHQGVGAALFWYPARWAIKDWFVMVTTIPALVLKITFLLGIGLGTNTTIQSRKTSSTKKTT